MSSQLEIYDISGTKQAQLDDRECEIKIRRVLNSEWNINVVYTIPPKDQGVDKSEYLQVLGAKLTIDEQSFIISKSQTIDDQGITKVIASGDAEIIKDLSGSVVSEQLYLVNITVEEALEKILVYSDNWSVGTITPTEKISVMISYETVMSGLQKILSAGNYEYDITGYNIDITNNIGNNNYVQVRPGRNLKSLRNTTFFRDSINKLFGVGGGQPPATIADAMHIVNSYSGSLLTVEGNKIVAENDSWNGFKILFMTGSEEGNSYSITDSATGSTNDTLTTNSGLSVSAGDRFKIIGTSEEAVPYIMAGDSIDSYGEIQKVLKDERFIDNQNFVETPALDGTYTSGLCENWTKSGTPTTTENTDLDYVQYGNKSQKVEATTVNHGVRQQSINVDSGEYYTLTVWLYLVSGKATIQLVTGSTYSVHIENTGWQRISLSEKVTTSTIDIYVILTDGTTTTFYLDAVSLTKGTLNRSFSVNSDMKTLWNKTYDKLILVKDPPVEYLANFVDLHRIDPQSFPFDEINLGDTVIITDENIGVSNLSLRATEINYNPFRPDQTVHTVSNL